MLTNYMQNSSLSVTKDSYFEMCEMLGEEPVEENIPIEFDDFPVEVQQALLVYKMMRDDWDSMAGIYLGKSFIGISDLMDTIEIESCDKKFITSLIRIIDKIRQDELNSKKAQKPAS